MVGGAKLGRGHERLPYLAFLHLAVSEHAVDPRGFSRELEAEGHAGGDRQSLTQRSRGRLDARKGDAIRMALRRAAQRAQGPELALGETAGLAHAELLGVDQ